MLDTLATRGRLVRTPIGATTLWLAFDRRDQIHDAIHAHASFRRLPRRATRP